MRGRGLRGLKRLISLGLSVCMLCLSISAYAQEVEPEAILHASRQIKHSRIRTMIIGLCVKPAC